MGHQYANLSCVLKVHPRCDACKKHAMEVLGSIDGVYDVTFDAESKTARIAGQVDPNWCIRALARCGVHAELLWANISHPKVSQYKSSTYGRHSYNDPYYNSSYGYKRSLPEGMWHETGHNCNYYPTTARYALPEYADYNSNYLYDASRRVPLYHQPRVDCYHYDDEESMSFCSVM